MKKCLLLVLISVFVFACSNPVSSTDSDSSSVTTPDSGSDSGSDSSSTTTISKCEVLDGNGNSLGYATSVDGGYISLYTSQGYFVYINWDGEIRYNGYFYYTEVNGGGTVYYPSSSIYTYNAKTAYRDIVGNLYTFKYCDSYGNTILNTSLTSASSTLNSDGTFTNYDPVIDISSSYDGGIEMIATTKSVIGIPDIITLPLSLKFD